VTVTRNEPSADPSGTTLTFTRVYDAPRELVWQAWTDPRQLLQWWGPRGFTTTTQHQEVRVGGEWRYVMHGPDGRDYRNVVTYLEVRAPERLRFRHGGEPGTEPVSHELSATFEPEGEGGRRTRLTMRMSFASQQARDHVVREYHADEGGRQTLARLDEHLQAARAPGAGAPRFVTSRVFRAPRERLFELWTQKEHLAQWFGPAGCTIPHCELDLRPGGAFLYCMRSPGAPDMWGKWVFREITRERLVFVLSFADPQGRVQRAPFAGDLPLQTLSTVTFTEHAGKGRGTLVTIEGLPLDASARELDGFAAGHDARRAGWGGTLDKLEALLPPAADTAN
jgi:uncharacterized protein YndB with AHSA1/START domain